MAAVGGESEISVVNGAEPVPSTAKKGPELSAADPPTDGAVEEPLVQYIVLRKDLVDKLEWPQGAAIAQACHASTAALHAFKDRDETKRYLDDIKNMHKVVLEAKHEAHLEKIAAKLAARDPPIEHQSWVEMPEKIVTALATRPYARSAMRAAFKGLRLFR